MKKIEHQYNVCKSEINANFRIWKNERGHGEKHYTYLVNANGAFKSWTGTRRKWKHDSLFSLLLTKQNKYFRMQTQIFNSYELFYIFTHECNILIFLMHKDAPTSFWQIVEAAVRNLAHCDFFAHCLSTHSF